MGAHRAHRRGLRRTFSGNPSKRRDSLPTPPVEARVAPEPAAPKPAASQPVAPQLALSQPAAPGRRKIARHTGRRRRLFPGLPSLPVAVGVAALAVSAGGAITIANPALVSGEPRIAGASALNGTSGAASTSLLNDRTAAVSRDSRRDALEDAADEKLVAQAEQQAQERNAALAKFAKQAEAQAAKIALNQWVLPVDDYHLTSVFGEWGLWASYHTGLDFAGDYGAPIKAMANGVVTEVGYDGSYGNKVVITLDDGTELWFCHMSDYAVSSGEEVRAGEVIGYIGNTGNTTGPHLHLEVRPGAGDPVDPYDAMIVHGLQP
jgi:murein DD-endopeptidase MepM/ murein hydrolase activator NlpD